jgi:hypothetical protein
MTRPGDRLRTMAARVFDRRTMERVVDPLVADLQVEHAEAIRRGRVWRSRWILLSGHVAFLKTIGLCGAEGVMRFLRGWNVEDRSAMSRTLGFSVAAIAVMTVAIELLSRNRLFVLYHPKLLVYLAPSALVLAVPIGITFGLLLGLRGRVVSRRSTGALLACAIFSSLACLVMMAWVVPLANREFRQFVFQDDVRRFERDLILAKGINELTLGELSQQIDSYRRTGTVTDLLDANSISGALLSYSYHMRWALSCATLVLALFALSVTRRIVAGWTTVLAAFGACFSYYVFMWAGRAAALQETLPAFVGAWLPNLVFAVVSVALLIKVRPTFAGTL